MPIQARTEFAAALNQLASEKGVEPEVIIETIEQAILAAYRKDLTLRNEPIPDDFDSYKVKVDPAVPSIAIMKGDENITPPGFARIAAQTAKQVISQRLHEAEKGAIVDEYAQKVGTVISGSIQRQEGNTYFIDLGRAEGVMPPSEQVRTELYSPNTRMKFYIKEIRETGRGPEVIVSRSDAELIKGLFATEVPEIQSGAVEIKLVAREAGGRTKLAAISNEEGVDPVGSLVGQKGVRVQAVINELGEEKVDIVPYSEDPSRFIASALSPAKDIIVNLDQENKVATVKVPEGQLSLAIGKGGQNVRLAAKLTGWKIDIEGAGEKKEEKVEEEKTEVKEEGTSEEEKQAEGSISEDGGAADDSAAPANDQAQSSDGQDVTLGSEATPESEEDSGQARMTDKEETTGSAQGQNDKQEPAEEVPSKEEAVEEIKEEEEKAEENATSPQEETEAKEAGEALVEEVQKEDIEEEKEQVEEAIGEADSGGDKNQES